MRFQSALDYVSLAVWLKLEDHGLPGAEDDMSLIHMCSGQRFRV
jgi:hypothetical protein